MPNHVHLLAAFTDQSLMEKQFDSWLHFTARKINRQTGNRGSFWQQEPFDHLVRSLEQYEYLRRYIAENPKKARLRSGEYLYRQALRSGSLRRSNFLILQVGEGKVK